MTSLERIEAIEIKLNQLLDAHRALGARHEGLMMVCRTMLPFIALSPADKKRMMLTAYDVLTEHMEKNKYDDDYQKAARAAIDELSSTILSDLPQPT